MHFHPRLVAGLVAFGILLGSVGCDDSSGSGGAGGSSTGSKSTSASTTGTSTTTSTGGSSCAPGATCAAVDKDCIGLVDNSAQMKFGLRMSSLDLTKPATLTSGVIKNIVGHALPFSDPSCNLNGGGTVSWLLQFDAAAKTLKTGGAKPVMNPTTGYSFVDESIQGKQVAPITFANVAPDASGVFAISDGTDIVLPVFLDEAATQVLLIPLKSVRFSVGKLSANKNCIGTYNAAGLDPATSCVPDDMHPQFIDGGSVDGYITLEDADTVDIPALQQSLCVHLTGDASMYGDGGMPVNRCKRINGGIAFKGDWCSSGNMPATGNCSDAVALAGQFAASSVLINN